MISDKLVTRWLRRTPIPSKDFLFGDLSAKVYEPKVGNTYITEFTWKREITYGNDDVLSFHEDASKGAFLRDMYGDIVQRLQELEELLYRSYPHFTGSEAHMKLRKLREDYT